MHNEQNIVHHDIKPENILVDGTNTAKIADFGISNNFAGGTDEIFNHEWGTKLYLPPEAWASTLSPHPEAALYGKAMDVWALGCTFYQMLYGRMPFEVCLKLEETAKHIIHGE